MAVRHLSPVPDAELKAAEPANSEVVAISRGPESTTERIRRLQWEARVLAAEHRLYPRALHALALTLATPPATSC